MLPPKTADQNLCDDDAYSCTSLITPFGRSVICSVVCLPKTTLNASDTAD